MEAIITTPEKAGTVLKEARRQFPRIADRIGVQNAGNGQVAVVIPRTLVPRDGWNEREFRVIEQTAC